MTGRTIRCRYCYESGHNRNGCPKVKADAIIGGEGSYAKDILDRAKVRQCSYCRETTHNLAKCEIKYADDKTKANKHWSGIQGTIEVIRKKKIAKNAFIYGPLCYAYHKFPSETYQGLPNYEMVNYIIDDMLTTYSLFGDETSNMLQITTLAEPEVLKQRSYGFTKYTPLPDLHKEVYHLSIYSDSHTAWLRSNDHALAGRNTLSQEFQVLVPAKDEDVEELAQRLLNLKPVILNYPDSESYRKSVRADKKLANGVK